MVLSRRKGSEHERRIARLLSEWWYQDPTVLRRTPLSGGWSKRHASAFDLIVAEGRAEEFPFGVECKFRESWNMDHLLAVHDGGEVGRWWKKLVQEDVPQAEAGTGRKFVPLLVFTKSRQPDYYATEPWVVEKLSPPGRRLVVESKENGRALVVGLLVDFLAAPPSREALGEQQAA